MGIVTDSGADVPKNVYAIHKLFHPESNLKTLYSAHKGQYKALKEALIADMEVFIAPLRAKRKQLATDPSHILKILAEGAEKARVVASEKMKVVQETVGVSLG